MNLGNYSGTQHSASIGERLASSMEGKIGHRADLFVSDFQSINKRAANALIGYSESIGKPDASEVEAFVLKYFGGKIVADLTNARNKANYSVIECILKVPVQKLEFEASEKMQPIVAGVRFLDTDLGSIWEAEGDEGEKMLVRENKEPIEAILMGRRRRMRSTSGMATFASIANEVGELEIAKDDYVQAYYDGEERQAVIASIGNDTVKIRLNDGKMATVAKNAVLRVTSKTSQHNASHINFLRDFYKQFTSDEIVDKLYPANKSADNLA